MTSSGAWARRFFGEAVRRATVCRRPGRATDSSSKPGSAARPNCAHTYPRSDDGCSPGEPGLGLRGAAGTTELREIDTAGPTDARCGPQPQSRGSMTAPAGGVASTPSLRLVATVQIHASAGRSGTG